MRHLVVMLILFVACAAAVALAQPVPGHSVQPPEPKRVTPAVKRKAAAPGPYVRGDAFLYTDGSLMVLRRKATGGAAGAYTMSSSGAWDKAFTKAPPEVLAHVKALTDYLDQVIAASPTP